MFPGMPLLIAELNCRAQKGYHQELRHEMPYLERLFPTPKYLPLVLNPEFRA